MTNETFEKWYLEFRNEMAKTFDVRYSITLASWTFSEKYRHFYDKRLTPKEAVLEYEKSKK